MSYQLGDQQTVVAPATTTCLDGVYVGSANVIDLSRCALLTEIPPRSFCDNKAIVTVVLHKNTRVVGNHAFSGCASLSEINIDYVTQIGERAFENCVSLEFFATSTQNLNPATFKGCLKLISAAFLRQVEIFPPEFFKNCAMLESLNTLGTVSVQESAFENTGLGLFNFQHVRDIRKNAFRNTPNLAFLNLGPVQNIGSYAFERSGIQNISFLDKLGVECERSTVTTTFGEGVFKSCVRLKRANLLPLKMEELPSETFMCCHTLTNVSIPDSLRVIGAHAFEQCPNINMWWGWLDYIEEVRTRAFFGAGRGYQKQRMVTDNHYNVPGSVGIFKNMKRIGDEAFAGCSAVFCVWVAVLESLGVRAFAKCPNLQAVKMADGVTITKIPEGAFHKCLSLQTLSFGKKNRITEIGPDAFTMCDIKKLKQNSTLHTIGDRAFHNCALEKIQIKKIQRIGREAFAELTAAITKIETDVNWTNIQAGEFAFRDNVFNLSPDEFELEKVKQILENNAGGVDRHVFKGSSYQQ